MKKIVLGLMLLSTSAIFAQIGQSNNNRNQPANRAPAPVQQSFQRDNPEAKDARWSQSNHEWRANYRDNNKRNVDVYYDRDGVRKDIHRALDRMDVPRNINNKVNSRYGGNYRVARIERPNEETLFQIKVQNGRRSHTLYMNERGENRMYNDRH